MKKLFIMAQTSLNQNSMPLFMHFAKTNPYKAEAEQYTYNDVAQKPMYYMDQIKSVKTKYNGGWTVDAKKVK